MKLLKQVTRLTVLVALVVSCPSLSAIEGLRLSVQCPDVILGWPSLSGETYIVQWRSTLSPSTPWETLTNSLPADETTNWTTFVHSNQVLCAAGDTNSIGGGESGPPPVPSRAVADTSSSQVSEPLVRPADGSGSTVPLCIYPPGFDLSGFIIFDPSTGEWVSGSGYTLSQPTHSRMQSNDPQPQDGPTDEPTASGPGFYQVVRDGVHVTTATNLTTGPVSNTITISFEAGNSIGTLALASLLIDGVPCRGAEELTGPPFYPGNLALDTGFLENGAHTLVVKAAWVNPDIDDINNFMLSRYSDTLTITVSNAIYYPEWEDEVGELGLTAYLAKTSCINTNWRIDIYDVHTNFVQTLTGHTDDGIIEAYWDMVDTNGVTRTNIDTDPEFSSVITVAESATKTTPKKKATEGYPAYAQWVIAYQDNFSFCANSNYYYQAIYDFGSLASQFGGAVTYPPTAPTNGQTWPLRYPYTNPVVEVPVWIMRKDAVALKDLLQETNSRNFYYNGHGSTNGIAGCLGWSEIAYALKHRPYRFVFLDSCDAATSKGAAAFGNNCTGVQPLSYFQRHKIRPRAFLGYDHSVYFLENGSFVQDGVTYRKRVKEEVHEFLTNFEFFWYFGYFGHDLASALYHAYISTPALPYGWQNGAGMQIYGYSGLTIDSYNAGSDRW